MNPVLALIIANLIWGAASPIFKFSLGNIPPFILLFIRFFVASLIFLPFVRGYHFEKLNVKEWVQIIIGTTFAFTIHIGTLFIGLEKTESINAPIILSSAPIFLFLASWLFLREKLHKKIFFGMIVSFVGVMVIIISPFLSDGVKHANFGGEIEGNFLYVISTLALVASIIILKPIMKKVPPLVITYLSFSIAALTFLPFALGELQTWSFSSLAMPGIVGIVFGVFLCSALAYFLYYYGLSKIDAQEIGIFTYTDPIAAMLVAAPLLGEYPDRWFLLASLLVFLGIYIGEGRIHYHPFHRLRQKTV